LKRKPKFKPLVNYNTLVFFFTNEMEAMSKDDASLKEKRDGMRLCQRYLWRKQ
jgi:hypothetical protein